jgi:hypothetical protein
MARRSSCARFEGISAIASAVPVAEDRRMRVVVLLVVLCSCDVVFRLDDVDGTGGDAMPDARVDAALLPACGQAHSGVLAGYPVNGDADSTRLTDYGPRAIHGAVTTGVVKTTPGPLDCGDALLIENDRGVTIPHDPAFDLDSGSFDLWVRAVGLGRQARRAS